MKAQISYMNKKTTIDFANEKGYIKIVEALEQIGINDRHFDIEANEVNLKYVEKEKGILKIIPAITNNKNSLYHISIATYYILNSDENFINALQTNINEGKIKDIRDIIDLHWNCTERYSSPSHFFLARPDKLLYEQINFKGQPALFTEQRIDSYLLPKNVYSYETMHDDDAKLEMTCLAKNIHVNFFGTIITTKPIELNDGYLFINEDTDIKYLPNQAIKLQDFLDYKSKEIKKDFYVK